MEFLKGNTFIKRLTRKDFVFGGFGLALATIFFRSRVRPAKKKTVKLLTQGGKLVELDIEKLPDEKRLATNADLKAWIKR